MNEDAEQVLASDGQLIEFLAASCEYRPDDPRQGPDVDEEVVDVFGDKFPGQVGVSVVYDGGFADLRAVEVGFLGLGHGESIICTWQ